MKVQAKQNMETLASSVKCATIAITRYELVIGCHSSLERFIGIDTKNGKALIERLVPGLKAGDVVEKTVMPDLKSILNDEKSHMLLIFVGHSDESGNLQLQQTPGEQQRQVNPVVFFQNLYGCRGKLTFFLYTCYSHCWLKAGYNFTNGCCRDIAATLTVQLRICTQSKVDVMNEKILIRQLELFYPPAREKSEAEEGKGHRHLNYDVDNANLSDLSSFKVNLDKDLN